MEDDFSFDDARMARPVFLTDADFAEARRDHDATASDAHEAMMAFMRGEGGDARDAATAREVFGEGRHSAELEDDPEAAKDLPKVSAKDLDADYSAPSERRPQESPAEAQAREERTAPSQETRESPAQSPFQSPAQATSETPQQMQSGVSAAQSSGATPAALVETSAAESAQASQSAPAESPRTAATGSAQPEYAKPSNLESSLADTALSNKRHKQFVVTGDPTFIKAFHTKLAEEGFLRSRGGQMVITASHSKAQSILQEVAEKMPGGQFHHAFHTEFDRSGSGLFGSAKAGLKNLLGRHNQFDVFVVGNQETVDNKLKELGSLLDRMDKNGFFDRSTASEKASALQLDADKKLILNGDGPVSLAGSKKISDLVILAQQTVEPYRQQEAAKDEARRAYRQEKDDAGIKERAEKEGGSPSAKDAGGSVAANKYASERAGDLEQALRNPASLGELNEKHQPRAQEVLKRNASVKDEEFATLPQERREAVLAGALALASKLDAGEYGEKAQKALDSSRPGEQSLRDKFAGWVAQERDRNPDFESNAKALVAEMVKTGFITEAQAKEVTASVRQEPASQANAGASELNPPAPNKDVASAAERVPAQGLETFRERLEQVVKEGPQALTPERASALLSEVDKLRDKPLAALDTRGGDGPTETLTRLEGVLKNISSERFDNSLREKAVDLQGTLEQWRKQDVERHFEGSGLTPHGDIKVARQVRELESAWHPERAPAVEPERGAATAAAERAESAPKAADAAPAEAVKSASSSPAVERAEAGAVEPSRAASPSQPASPGRDLGAAPAVAAEPAVSAERVELARRDVETLSRMMSSPAGTFTTRDKTWNEGAVQKVSQLVARLDTAAVGQLSPEERKAAASYSAWVADGAASGKLPGFTSEEGKTLAGLVTASAVRQVNDVAGLGATDKSVDQALTRADRMANRMNERELGREAAPAQAATASQRSGPHQDASLFAKELVQAVYKEGALSEAYVKYLLKNSSQLTPESMQSLDPETKARSAAALNFLANTVRNGGMGDFDSLSPAVQRHTTGAVRTADALHDAMGKDPSMATPVMKAHMDLDRALDKNAASETKSAAPEATKADSMQSSKPDSASSAGRAGKVAEMER